MKFSYCYQVCTIIILQYLHIIRPMPESSKSPQIIILTVQVFRVAHIGLCPDCLWVCGNRACILKALLDTAVFSLPFKKRGGYNIGWARNWNQQPRVFWRISAAANNCLVSFGPLYPCTPARHQHHQHSGSSEPIPQRCGFCPRFVHRSCVYYRLPIRSTAHPQPIMLLLLRFAALQPTSHI